MKHADLAYEAGDFMFFSPFSKAKHGRQTKWL